MANINPTLNRALQGAQSVALASWALGNADTGVAIEMTDWSDRSVQVEGTFGAATVVIQGSNDGANFETLRDPQGVALSFTSSGLKQVLETTRFIRPASSGGTATAVTVTMVMRKNDPASWS
jgi:hypothetical protein